MAPESERATDKACLCYCCEGNLRELCPDWQWEQYPTQRGWCRHCFSEILRTEKLPQSEWHECKPKPNVPAPASCSEVADMLAKCIIGDYTPNALGGAYKGVFTAQFDREQAEMILSDWRKQITVRGGE